MANLYHIEAQRDLNRDKDTDETQFVECDDKRAEIFAVYLDGDGWVDDFPTRDAAEAFVQQRGGSVAA